MKSLIMKATKTAPRLRACVRYSLIISGALVMMSASCGKHGDCPAYGAHSPTLAPAEKGVVTVHAMPPVAHTLEQKNG